MRRSPAAALLVFTARAAAQESLDELDRQGHEKANAPPEAPAQSGASGPKLVEVNGYAANRFQYSLIDPGATLVSTADQPSLSDLLEANVQLRVHLGEKAFVYGDVSLLLQGGGLYYQDDGKGGRARVDEHFVSSLQPFVATNELYVSYSPRPWLNFLAGKKRIVWGSGLAFNPTDLINPPKDPTDPNFQRAGAWLARVELPFEKFTLSALFAPSVLYSANGLPASIFQYPSYAIPGVTADTDSHYLVAARLYALVFDSDINVFYYFTNKFNDAFANKSRVGLSFSRYFLTDYELHVDALFQLGSARLFANDYCFAPGAVAPNPGCPIFKNDTIDPTVAFGASKLTSGAFYPRVLVGGRTTFRDESTLSVEYYYQSDGSSDQEFRDLLVGLTVARRFGYNLSPGAPSGGGVPLRFTFDPQRRHYLIVSYSKPKIRDDWTATLVLIAGLRDLSGMVSPTVAWNAREWLTLSLYGFIPIRGIPVGQVQIGDRSYSEYGLLPFDFRLLFEARAFY